MTRTEDVKISLDGRTAMRINNHRMHILVSIIMLSKIQV
ncbi:hypothetical protein KQI21_04685 [Virgibacillus proomii]|nr:hypothetical protein [Virgibacillus proomii]